ncbi:MAG: prepilin-type N-terminal cleavage/methylation domain-containing protein [Desulfobacteraceae bacterium]|nr:prepilin-type N-terminal cleavage/methylation domain-containing protein [Desulfobacteraceae bacterium]MBC2754532.1 prepilin-type N-terminal cleavage/methylation domain-containing protein [Desulfobacteraceae bacterium]MBC2763803.1 prepilin-type N-terminal cleavage/methylation domain-containing protein [ANME-2 cluster archaeon]
MHLIPGKYSTRPVKLSQSAGFTLIELMIALAITGIISAAMYSIFQAQVRGQVSQDVSLEMTQSLRAAMEMMSSDIRMAGCDPADGGNAQIVTANSNELRVTMDIGGGPQGQPDGDTTDPNEDVRYAINATGNLGRAVGGGLLQPIALFCDVLDFVYIDMNGNPFVPVTADDRDNVGAIQVSTVVRSADIKNPGFLSAYTDNTSYTNLQGTEILPPPGDTFRRFQLSATIVCRNLQ